MMSDLKSYDKSKNLNPAAIVAIVGWCSSRPGHGRDCRSPSSADCGGYLKEMEAKRETRLVESCHIAVVVQGSTDVSSVVGRSEGLAQEATRR